MQGEGSRGGRSQRGKVRGGLGNENPHSGPCLEFHSRISHHPGFPCLPYQRPGAPLMGLRWEVRSSAIQDSKTSPENPEPHCLAPQGPQTLLAKNARPTGAEKGHKSFLPTSTRGSFVTGEIAQALESHSHGFKSCYHLTVAWPQPSFFNSRSPSFLLVNQREEHLPHRGTVKFSGKEECTISGRALSGERCSSVCPPSLPTPLLLVGFSVSTCPYIPWFPTSLPLLLLFLPIAWLPLIFPMSSSMPQIALLSLVFPFMFHFSFSLYKTLLPYSIIKSMKIGSAL